MVSAEGSPVPIPANLEVTNGPNELLGKEIKAFLHSLKYDDHIIRTAYANYESRDVQAVLGFVFSTIIIRIDNLCNEVPTTMIPEIKRSILDWGSGDKSQRIHAHLAHLQLVLHIELPKYHGPVVSAILITSTIEFLVGCAMESLVPKGIACPTTSSRFPVYLREKTGLGYFNFPEELFPASALVLLDNVHVTSTPPLHVEPGTNGKPCAGHGRLVSALSLVMSRSSRARSVLSPRGENVRRLILVSILVALDFLLDLLESCRVVIEQHLVDAEVAEGLKILSSYYQEIELIVECSVPSPLELEESEHQDEDLGRVIQLFGTPCELELEGDVFEVVQPSSEDVEVPGVPGTGADGAGDTISGGAARSTPSSGAGEVRT
ncbi:hypothetical protein R1sor_005547 [Riccia sorocarpa]|uniref:Uncharacterized protein n=1 Tax=Riccia sorocarpa TaxID=122646 RepID=A0ABD3HM55_9MARC